MVGYEMLAMPQRDITAETAARWLRDVPGQHFLDIQHPSLRSLKPSAATISFASITGLLLEGNFATKNCWGRDVSTLTERRSP